MKKIEIVIFSIVILMIILSFIYDVNSYYSNFDNCWMISDKPIVVGYGPAKGWAWRVICEEGTKPFYSTVDQ